MNFCQFFCVPFNLMSDAMATHTKEKYRDYNRQSEDNEHVINGLDKGTGTRLLAVCSMHALAMSQC